MLRATRLTQEIFVVHMTYSGYVRSIQLQLSNPYPLNLLAAPIVDRLIYLHWDWTSDGLFSFHSLSCIHDEKGRTLISLLQDRLSQETVHPPNQIRPSRLIRHSMQRIWINSTEATPARRWKSSIERFHHVGPVHTSGNIFIRAAPEEESGDFDLAECCRSDRRGGVHTEEIVVTAVG